MAKSIKPKHFCFRGLTYRIHWRRPRHQPKTCGGTCDHPKKRNPAMEILPSLRGENRLRVMLDESIHACHWDLDNDSVAETSACISAFLWQCGLRFDDEKLK